MAWRVLPNGVVDGDTVGKDRKMDYTGRLDDDIAHRESRDELIEKLAAEHELDLGLVEHLYGAAERAAWEYPSGRSAMQWFMELAGLSTTTMVPAPGRRTAVQSVYGPRGQPGTARRATSAPGQHSHAAIGPAPYPRAAIGPGPHPRAAIGPGPHPRAAIGPGPHPRAAIGPAPQPRAMALGSELRPRPSAGPQRRDPPVLVRMSELFGFDFSDVRIHTHETEAPLAGGKPALDEPRATPRAGTDSDAERSEVSPGPQDADS